MEWNSTKDLGWYRLWSLTSFWMRQLYHSKTQYTISICRRLYFLPKIDEVKYTLCCFLEQNGIIVTLSAGIISYQNTIGNEVLIFLENII